MRCYWYDKRSDQESVGSVRGKSPRTVNKKKDGGFVRRDVTSEDVSKFKVEFTVEDFLR